MDPNESVLEACDGTDVFGASWEDFGGVGWISENRKMPQKTNWESLKIWMWLTVPVRDPYVVVWAGIDPNRNRLIIRMDLGPLEGLLDFRFSGVRSETSF